MENAADALIMAGQVLIFIIALTVSMSSFTTLRAGIDDVLGYTETVDMAKDTNGYRNYIQGVRDDATRVVGIETVVASLYRAIKEDYVIYIIFNNPGNILTQANLNNWNAVKTKIRKSPSDSTEVEALKFTIGIQNDGVNKNINEVLDKGFYNTIKNMNFEEYLGEYQEYSAEGVSTENKMTNRIITFKEI